MIFVPCMFCDERGQCLHALVQLSAEASEVIAGFNSGQQTAPAVTVLANGNIAVAFVDVPAADVYVQIFAPTWGSPLRLDSIGGGTAQSLPSITPFADGSYVVAYTAATAAPKPASWRRS